MPALLYEKRGAVVWMTINRPEVSNALDPEVLVRIADSWVKVAEDDDVRAVVLTGAGGRAFSAGADLRRLAPLLTRARQPEDEWDEAMLQRPDMTDIVFLRRFKLNKPIIVAINGHCIAGGMELMLASDIRLSVPHAMFGLAEVKRGLIPAGGSMVRLPAQIPYCMAMEMLLVGDQIGAAEAYRIGLVNRIVPAAELLETAQALAEKIAQNGPLAVRKVKETVTGTLGQPQEHGFALEDDAMHIVIRSEDAREGPRAFAEKRPPRYTGR